MLGEITHDDATYAGDTGDSLISLQYYRNKASEFQAVLISLDAARASLVDTLGIVYESVYDQDLLDSIQLHLADLENQRGYYVAAADALNLGGSALNAVGVRFPSLSVPSGLGIAPAALAGIAAAVATVAGLVILAKAWIDGSLELQQQAQALAATSSPEARDAIAAQIVRTSAARSQANNPLGDIANIAKWSAIAVIGYLAYQAWSKKQRG